MKKSVMITGGTGGIGSAIAERYARAGAHVIIHHLGDEEAASALSAKLQKASPTATVGLVEGDITKEDDVLNFVASAQEQVGGCLDVLINNAGIMFERPIDTTTATMWREVIDVNLTGMYLVTQAVLPSMRDQGSGTIINIASQLAFKGAPALAAYCASKAGVVGLTRALARELGPAIRVYTLAPGPVDTPMIEPYATEEWISSRTGSLVIGRLGKPDEVAGVCMFLSGPDAQLLQGQVLHCNGGGYFA